LSLNVYVTNTTLAGTTAQSYGFAVSSTGLGGATFSAGAGGAALGVSNGTALTISEFLASANARAKKGLLRDANADGSTPRRPSSATSARCSRRSITRNKSRAR
jgi:hypothetical protein